MLNYQTAWEIQALLTLCQYEDCNTLSDTSNSLNIGEDFDGHVGDVQSGLDNLRELLKQEQYSIDSNTLMTLFGADADTSELLSLKPGGVGGNDVNEEKSSSDPSSEMVAYNPSLYELADEDFFDYQNNGVFLDDELESMLTTDRDKLNKGDLKDMPLP